MIDELIGSLIAGAGGMGGVVAALLARARGERAVKALAEQLARSDDARLVKRALHGVHAGIEYRVRATDQAHALLSVVCPDRGRVRLSRRTAFDARASRLLPHERFATGHRAFDERVQVQTRDPVLARRWLGRAEVRAGVLGFAERVPCLHLDGPRLKHTLPLSRITGDDGVAALHETVERLGALVAPLHEGAFAHLPRPAPRRDAALRASWWIVAGLGVASLAALFVVLGVLRAPSPPPLAASPFGWALPAGLLVPLLALPFLARLVAARSAPWRLLAPQAALLLVAGVVSGFALALAVPSLA